MIKEYIENRLKFLETLLSSDDISTVRRALIECMLLIDIYNSLVSSGGDDE